MRKNHASYCPGWLKCWTRPEASLALEVENQGECFAPFVYKSFTKCLVPGGPPSFAASAEKICHFSHHFFHFGEVLGQILRYLEFQIWMVFRIFFDHIWMFWSFWSLQNLIWKLIWKLHFFIIFRIFDRVSWPRWAEYCIKNESVRAENKTA